jgi:MinD-like ATPase involved in chromosome partitioning or flagellar assembly
MSADDDRGVPPSDPARVEGERAAPDGEPAAEAGLVAPAQPQAGTTPMSTPPPRPSEITTQMRAARATGAHYAPPRPAQPPQPPAPAPSPHPMAWATTAQQLYGAEPAPTAGTGNHRAIDALSNVGVRTATKMPPQQGWRHLLYLLTRINLGLSPDELYEQDLHARIRRNARGLYQIGIFGLKGGVGKTAVTVALGSTLSTIRGDRILAVDADPDGGNLADRVGRRSAATAADLLSDKELHRYNDIRAYTSMNGSNLEVLSSEEYSVARREFNDQDWRGIVEAVSRYYNLVLADGGAGLFHPATRGVLSTAAGLVIVASASIDGARQAAVTMDWLRQHGYHDLLGRLSVVINHVVPGKPNIDVALLVQQFERHVRPGRVVVLPYDKHIAAGTEIHLDLLGETFRRRITELAAALSDDFDGPERR